MNQQSVSNNSIPNSKEKSNTNIKYSMQESENNTQNDSLQENNNWQEYLDNNKINEVTRTKLRELKLPVSEEEYRRRQDKENKQEEIDNIGKISKVTSKVDKYQKKAEKNFKENIINDFGVSKYANNQKIINEAIYELEKNFNKTGDIDSKTIEKTFEYVSILFDFSKDRLRRLVNVFIENIKNNFKI